MEKVITDKVPYPTGESSENIALVGDMVTNQLRSYSSADLVPQSQLDPGPTAWSDLQ